MIRMAEMRESCSIIAQVCEHISDGFITVPCQIRKPTRADMKHLWKLLSTF